ncbi:G3E family GTPase [Bradyrhizobium sp. USDA 4354]
MTREPQKPPDGAPASRRREAMTMLMGIFEAARLIPPGVQTGPTLPLTLISGFLGAGKTTLINRLLSERHGRRIAVLVNDFGAINIDQDLIRSRSDEAIGLTNGCACCSISGDLTKALLRLLQRSDPPDAVVLEASGVADPHGIAQVALANPAIRLNGILTLVDAETFLDRVQDPETAWLVSSQLTAADLIVLNKVDLLNGRTDFVRTRIEQIAAPRTIVEVVQADIPVDVVLGINTERTSGVRCTTEAHASSFASWTGSWDVPLDRELLLAGLRQLPANVIRAKGVFTLEDDPVHRSVYQRVGRRESFDQETAVRSCRTSSLVIIGPSSGWSAREIERHFAAVATRPAKTMLKDQ